MKYLKNFENLKEPKVGDYVICSALGFNIPSGYRHVIKRTIGQIINIDYGGNEKRYLVKIGKLETYFERYQIIHFSKDKEDLKIYFDIKKYNV